jgi:hypothetical protein
MPTQAPFGIGVAVGLGVPTTRSACGVGVDGMITVAEVFVPHPTTAAPRITIVTSATAACNLVIKKTPPYSGKSIRFGTAEGRLALARRRTRVKATGGPRVAGARSQVAGGGSSRRDQVHVLNVIFAAPPNTLTN